MSRLKLHFAFALSVLLHGVLIIWPATTGDTRPVAVPRLQARLQSPPVSMPETAVVPPADPLLKDTRSLLPDDAPSVAPAPETDRAAKTAGTRAQEQARRRLNRYVFYPPEAIERELEGEVTLRLLLDRSGLVIEAAIMAGSGHALLDQAALDAARQIGRIDAGGARELLLPVVFRLD